MNRRDRHVSLPEPTTVTVSTITDQVGKEGVHRISGVAQAHGASTSVGIAVVSGVTGHRVDISAGTVGMAMIKTAAAHVVVTVSIQPAWHPPNHRSSKPMGLTYVPVVQAVKVVAPEETLV